MLLPEVIVDICFFGFMETIAIRFKFVFFFCISELSLFILFLFLVCES
jgi:hypothetical protein